MLNINSVNINRIQIIKKTGSNMSQSSLISGVLLDKKVCSFYFCTIFLLLI
jgi:hypothetical protein